MKRKDKKFEYRDKKIATLPRDMEFIAQREFDLAEVAKAFNVPSSMLSMDKKKISVELAEDSIVSLEPFFANAFSDAFKSVAEGAESFAVTMKEFGDKIREGVQESVAKGLMEALTFDDIKNVMFEIDEQTKAKGIFQMSPKAYEQIQEALGTAVNEYDKQKEEERREREEQFEKLLRAAEGIERERNLDLLKIKKKILELRNPVKYDDDDDDDDDVFFESGSQAVRVRERFVTGGVLVPNAVADQVQRIVGEQSIVRQVSRAIPLEQAVSAGWSGELLEASPVPIPSDPDAIFDIERYRYRKNPELPPGAIVAFDGKEVPAGWEPVEGAPGRFIKKLT